YHGYNGTSKFEEQGPYKKLRAMFSLHTEPFNIIARADSGIENVEDLKGKRVNIGNPGSGDRATMGVVMEAMGWTNDSFKLASELKGSERSQALCDNKIDAMIYTVGHPSGAIKEATTSCDSNIVTVAGPNVEKLVADNSFYRVANVPGGMYRGTD
ncbi:TAXI family TRAP transporter solute-binding subunit, partial [Vibrio parahaemolyticus]|uniref:TAXI family TRAP transporter solute-binding subunit n=1 Tax=Vibrio parahaemolyticus TaxID=670 RepID=UPI00146E0FA0